MVLESAEQLDSIFQDEVRSDFRNFLFLVWEHLNLPPPTPIQYEIAEYLQHGPNRQIIEAFRGVGKSWITSAFVLWTLLNDPQAKILVVSASKQRADDFSTFTLRLINEMPILAHLRPTENQRSSKVSFDVGPALAAHAPSVTSKGITSQLSGSRATHIIADDIEVPNNSSTQDMRDKLIKACTEFEAIMTPGGRITFLGTPQTEESVYNHFRRLVDRNGKRLWDARIWPARVPLAEKVNTYGDALASSIKEMARKGLYWMPTDPDRFDEDDLMEREGTYGRSGFALQFMLDTSPTDADLHPLKISDLMVMHVNQSKAPIMLQYANDPGLQHNDLPNPGFDGDRWFSPWHIDKEWADYEGSVMAIDPSGRGTDETGYAVVKILHGYLYLTRSGGFTGGYDDPTLIGLARIAKEEKVNMVVIEDNFGDGMFSKLFQPVLNRYHKCSIEEVKNNTQKEMRIISALEPVMNRHKLIVDKSVVEQDLKQMSDDPYYSLFHQMTRLTKDRGCLRHDDRIEALAMAVKYWTESLARDELEAVAAFKRRELDKDLKEFMDSAMGSTMVAHGMGRKQSYLYGMRKDSVFAQRSRKPL